MTGLDALEAHLAAHVGPVTSVLHDMLPIGHRVDVLVVPESPAHPWQTLVTCGMSERAMAVPPEYRDACPPHAELVIMLPPGWPIDRPGDPDTYWPVEQLKLAARLPAALDTWLGHWHGIPNGDPPEPYAPGTDFCALAVMPPIVLPDEFRTVADGAKPIELLALVPLHADEWAAKLAGGIDALLPGFEAAGVTDLLDPARASVIADA